MLDRESWSGEVSFWWCGRGNDAMQEWVSGGQSRLLHGREREETWTIPLSAGSIVLVVFFTRNLWIV